MGPKASESDPVRIALTIRLIRGHKVVLDSDLAALYGVETRRLNEQVRRNADRFPVDFMFQLSLDEMTALMSQFATSNGRGGRRKRPLVFTEHGALMAATVLNSSHAVEVALYVVRAFVRLREAITEHKELAAKLDELEKKTQALAVEHDSLATNTRIQLKQVFEAIRELMAGSLTSTTKRPIGFVTGETVKRG